MSRLRWYGTRLDRVVTYGAVVCLVGGLLYYGPLMLERLVARRWTEAIAAGWPGPVSLLLLGVALRRVRLLDQAIRAERRRRMTQAGGGDGSVF